MRTTLKVKVPENMAVCYVNTDTEPLLAVIPLDQLNTDYSINNKPIIHDKVISEVSEREANQELFDIMLPDNGDKTEDEGFTPSYEVNIVFNDTHECKFSPTKRR